MIRSFQEIVLRAGSLPPQKVAVLYPDDPDVMKAVKEGRRRNYIDPILIGIKPNMQAVAGKIGFDLNDVEIVHIEDEQKGADFCVDQVIDGKVGFIIKGKILTTYMYRSLIKATKKLKPDEAPCTICYHQIKGVDKLFAITDPGVNIRPDIQTKFKILNNAISLLRRLEFDRIRVMILSAKREISRDLTSAKDGEILRNMFLEHNNDGTVSIDKEINLIEAFGNKLCKTDTFPDLFLVPNIETGNILVKAIDHLLLGFRQCVTVGAGIITLMPSRSDGYEERILNMALGTVLANNSRNNLELP
jgi:phosphate butyryltransferase